MNDYTRDQLLETIRRRDNRVAELIAVLHRCELWLSTYPEGAKMQAVVREAILGPDSKVKT